MPTLQEIMLRAQALRQETAVDSISPERAGSIMYDTLAYINQMQLQGANPLLISKIYASVEAMEADSAPVSDLTGEPLRPGQVVVIATGDPDDPDEGVVYRYDGTEDGASSWTAVGKIGNVEPVDSLDSDSTQLPLAAHQGKVLDGKITELGQEIDALDNKAVYIVRKNLLDISSPDNQVGWYIDSGGVLRNWSSAMTISPIIPVEPDTDYYASADGDIVVGNVNVFGRFYHLDGTTTLFPTNTQSVHTPADCYAVDFSYLNTQKFIQFERGNSRTSYEGYKSGNVEDITKPNAENVLGVIRETTPANLAGNHCVTYGVYVSGDGTFNTAASWKTYVIKVSPGVRYRLNSSDYPASADFICFKDIDGRVLSFASNTFDVTAPESSYELYVSFEVSAMAQVTATSSPIAYQNGDQYIAPGMLFNIESVMPRQEFIIKGEQNSFYHSEYCRHYDDNVVYADKTSGNWTFLKRCWRIESGDNTSGNLAFSMRDRRTNSEIKSYNIPIRVGDKAKTNTNIKVNIIGDSFCYGGHYIKQIADCCGNANFVGMRKTQYYPTIFCEGRSGWTLAQYFNPKSTDIALTHMQPFSPFMQAAGYNYYGVKEFWACIVNNTSQYAYGTDGFDTYVSWFGTDGRKLNPSSNDLMYNQTDGKFEYWNGSAWMQLADDPDFSFDYSKYVSIWRIASPDFVVIQLGTNDFFGGNADYDEWFTRMDSVVESIKTYATAMSKTINVLICTPLTASGLPGNVYRDGVIKKNSYYYDARERIIQKYDPSAKFVSHRVTVVDTGISVDDEYGFLTEERLPFAYYTGDARELFDINGVHPNEAGYKQFGNPIAGAIQYLR